LNNILRDGDDESELGWAVCQIVLVLHAKNASIPLDPNDMKGSFKDISQRMVDVIKEYYS